MFNTSNQLKDQLNSYVLIRFLVVFCAGAFAGFGQAPFSFPIVTLLGVGAGLYLAPRPCDKGHFFHGWALGLGYFVTTLWWVTEPFHVDEALTGFLAVPALLAMCGGLALFWGAAFRVSKGRSGLFLCACFALVEVVRSYILTGFPWGLIGYVWIDTPVYQIASLVGPHGMTLLTLVAAYMLFRVAFVYRALLLGVVIALQIAGPVSGPMPEKYAPTVRLISPNASQADKWHPDKQEGIYQSQRSMTALTPNVDLVIWPETSIYFPFPIALPEIEAVANGANVIVGAQRRHDDGIYYNSAFLIGREGELSGTYDKHRLVPFGEYIPLGEFFAQFGVRGLAAQSGAWFGVGMGPDIWDVEGVGRVQPLICYEGIFPQYVRQTPVRPDVIVLISNDAWFGETNGPAQHLAQARARAIELGLPILRVANRGTSAVIDARGNIQAKITNDYAAGHVTARIPAALPETLYARIGDFPVVFLLLILMGFLGFRPKWFLR